MFSDYSEGWGNQLITESCEYGLNLYDYNKRDYLLFHFDNILKSSNGCCYVVQKDGKKGLYDADGKLLYNVIYDDIDVREDIIVTILNGCVVIYDFEGNIIFDKQYQIVPKLGNRIKWGDRGIKIKEWDSIFLAQPRIVRRNGKWGCINKDLWGIYKKQDIPLIKEYIPCEYEKIAYSNKELVSESTFGEDDYIRYFIKEEKDGNLHYFDFQLKDDVAVLINDWIEQSHESLYLFFDTETTGTPINRKAPSSDVDNWPRIVQLSWLLMTENGERISEKNYLVKPNGFTIPEDATKIHGISTKMALAQGFDLSFVISEFMKDFKRARYIVGHNIDFDKKVVGAELVRLSKPDIMNVKKAFCTMKLGVDFCKINGMYGFNYPKLQELYCKLFGRYFEKAHDAASDVEATQQCFWELKKRKVV